MARVCMLCDKHPQVGNLVSHARNRVKRWIYPNVQRLNFRIKDSGSATIHRGAVCTKCMKAGKIEKVV